MPSVHSIAAAGGHHVALLGRAGVGKTLLAERLPGILPDLDDEQALEVTSIHQLSGRDGGVSVGLARNPPWFAPPPPRRVPPWWEAALTIGRP